MLEIQASTKQKLLPGISFLVKMTVEYNLKAIDQKPLKYIN